MRASFLLDPTVVSRRPSDPAAVVAWDRRGGYTDPIYVCDDDGRLLGRITGSGDEVPPSAPLDRLMEPVGTFPAVLDTDDREDWAGWFAAHPKEPEAAVVDAEGRLKGRLRPSHAIPRPTAPASWSEVPADVLRDRIAAALQAGLMIVDTAGITRYLNAYGAELLGVDASRVVGKPYEEVAQAIFSHMTDYLRESAVPHALSGGAPEGERLHHLQNGRDVLFRYGTIADGSRPSGLLILFMDVTALRDAETKALRLAEEAEMAFGLTLPNTKVAQKLRTSPEYRDRFDPETGTATVTAVIPDGTYRHVINALRLLADLHRVGVLDLVGIDKDTLVQAVIFHDIGKEQPKLAVGDVFVPAETFEPGPRHAARSAEWAAQSYSHVVTSDALWLVRHHHTPEEALPPDFPEALRPMLRLLKLVDGLSAAVTRRGATVAPFILEGSYLTVSEENPDPRYHRTYRLAIYQGTEEPLPARPALRRP